MKHGSAAALGVLKTRRLRRVVRLCTGALVVLGVVEVVLLWGIVGLSMRAGFLPFVDVGYRWFDGNVVPFFGFS